MSLEAYNLTVAETLSEVKSSNAGLTAQVVDQRQKTFGKNEIPAGKGI